MITDIFSNRYPEIELDVPQAFFTQLFNLYDDHDLGVNGALMSKAEEYSYSSYADEHIRIIALSMKKICNEMGYESLNKPQYIDPNWGYEEYRVFKNYIFDLSIDAIEKLSFFEILFREAENHLLNEVSFLKASIPTHEKEATRVKQLSEIKKANFYNRGQELLDKLAPKLRLKEAALSLIRTEINQRLKQYKIPFSYHNGYFQRSEDAVVEEKIESPFWELISDPKYKNVESDMLQAVDRYDSGDKTSAFFASKALESMIKIVCADKDFSKGKEKGASDYLNHLNSRANGSILINDERDELLSMFRIRNSQGHGAGNEPMPELSDAQTLRYINSAMVWIKTLSER